MGAGQPSILETATHHGSSTRFNLNIMHFSEHMMTKFLATFLFLVVSVFGQQALAEDVKKSSPLQVGVIVPLSGELASFGRAIQQGVAMAVSEGITPRVRFTYEDDKSGDRAATIGALNSLLQRKQIRVAVMTGMPNVAAADSIVRRGSVIALSAWDSNEQINALSSNTFGYGWSNEKTGGQMGLFACNPLNARSAAVVVGHDEWSEILSRSFSTVFEGCGGKIAVRESVELDSTDFRSLAAKIVRLNPQVVYFPLYRASLLSFAKQIKQAGYSGTLLSAEGFTEAEIQQLGKLADGMYITSAYLSDSDFESRYKTKFGLSRVELNLAHVGLGHEIANFLNQSIEKLSSEGLELSIENLRNAISHITVSDVLGTVSFQGRKAMDRPQVILFAENGKLSRVTN